MVRQMYFRSQFVNKTHKKLSSKNSKIIYDWQMWSWLRIYDKNGTLRTAAWFTQFHINTNSKSKIASKVPKSITNLGIKLA